MDKKQFHKIVEDCKQKIADAIIALVKENGGEIDPQDATVTFLLNGKHNGVFKLNVRPYEYTIERVYVLHHEKTGPELYIDVINKKDEEEEFYVDYLTTLDLQKLMEALLKEVEQRKMNKSK